MEKCDWYEQYNIQETVLLAVWNIHRSKYITLLSV